MKKRLKILQSIISVIVILTLLLRDAFIVYGATYNIDFEESTECSLQPSQVSKALFLQNPIPNMTDPDFTPTTGSPYYRWNSDYNYSLTQDPDNAWIPERNNEAQRGWSTGWDSSYGFSGLSATTGCGHSMNHDAVMYAAPTVANSIKLHRRKFSIPTGEYVSGITMNYFSDYSAKFYINGKALSLTPNGNSGHTYSGSITDITPFVAGNNLLAVSLYNQDTSATGLQYDMNIITSIDITKPVIPDNALGGQFGPGKWNRPGQILTVAATDAGGAGIANTYGLFSGTKFYKGSGPLDNYTYFSQVVDGATYNIYPAQLTTPNPADYGGVNTFNVSCTARDRANNWATIKACGTIKVDMTSPTITPSSVVGNSLSATASDTESGIDWMQINATNVATGAQYNWWSTPANRDSIQTNFSPSTPTGYYTFVVLAQDYTGRRTTINIPGQHLIDVTAPSNPDPATAQAWKPGKTTQIGNNTSTATTSPIFTWGESVDNTGGAGVAHYAVSLQTSTTPPSMSGEGAATVTTPEYTPPALSTSGVYNLFVRADDQYENKSAWANMFTYKYDGDAPNNLGAISETRYNTASGGDASPYYDPVFEWSAVADNPNGFSAVSYDIFWSRAETCSSIPTGQTPNQTLSATSFAPNNISLPGAYCLQVFPKDAAGNTPTSGGNRAGGSSFLYTYGGTIPPAAYIHAITAATNSAVPDVEAFSNDIANDGSWTVMYGPTFSGTLAVAARTGAGNVGDALVSPASALVFPAMLDAAAAQTVAVPTEDNGQNYVYEAEHTYTFAPGASVDGQTYFVDVTPTGATTQRAIHFILEDSAPVIGNLAPTSDGVVVIDGAGKIHVGPNTSTLSISFTATEPDSGNGRSRLARVTCPAAFGSAAQDLTISGAGYTCVYPMTARTPGEHNLSIQAADNFANVGAQAFSVVYDASAPEVTLDVPDHPGLTYFVAWTAQDDVAVESFDAKLVDAVDSDLDGDVDAADNNCAAEGLDIEVEGKETRLELANTGKGFCLRAKDALGNQSAWAWGMPGFKTVATLTYGFGGVNVVERVGEDPSDNETVYIVGDHLGSASLALKPDGAAAASARYLPFGEERWDEVDLPSDRGFTGQRAEKGFGLMDFKARFYSPRLMLFISPDSLVPDPYNALDWNRYLYVRANSINLTDPSGNKPCINFGDNGECITDPIWSQKNGLSPEASLIKYGYEMAKSMKGYWNDNGKSNFSVNDFLGLFSYWEIASLNSGKQDDALQEATARRIFGRGYCKESCSPSQIYTFLAKNGGSVQYSRINGMLSNNGSGYPFLRDGAGTFSKLMETARDWGNKLLNTPDWKITDNNRPSNWGNANHGSPAADLLVANMALAESRGGTINFGSGRSDIYFRDGDFIISSVNQDWYWTNYK